MRRFRPGVPLGQIIKGQVTKINTFLLYFEVDQRFRIYADLFDPSAALPRLNDTVEVKNPVKFIGSTCTAVMGPDTICSFSKNSDSQTNPFFDLFQTNTVQNDADEILAIDRLVRRLEPFVTPHAVQLCVKTLYGCVPNSFEDLKSFKQILGKTPKDLQYSNCTSQDYDFLNFDGRCTYSVYPNKIAELDADCETEYLFGFLAAREMDGCMSLKDHLSEILVKFMVPHENLEKLNNSLVLVKKYTVFSEIYQNPKQQTLDYILMNSEDVFIVMSGIDKGRRKLIYGKEESLPTDLKYSYFLQISRMSEVVYGYNSGAECWFEALISPYEHFRPSEWVYVVVPKELIEIKPFLEEHVIYKIFTNETIKYVNLKSYAELYGMREREKVMVLSVDSIFTRTEFQPVGYSGVVSDDFHEIKSYIANTADYKTISFVLNVSKKEFQPFMYRSWFPKRHQNMKYFGNIDNYQQKVVFWNEGTNSYIDLFLSNRDNHFIPLGLIPNMKVIIRNVQVYKRKYLKSTVFTSFEIVDYCPEMRFACANLLFNDRSIWWWRKNTTSTMLGLYKRIPKNCVVHGTVKFRALVDLKLMMICSKCGKRFMDQCCIYCSSTEKDFQVYMIIHGQDAINTPFYMEVNDIWFLLQLVGLNETRASKAFFQDFFDPLEINFLNIPEDFVINMPRNYTRKTTILSYTAEDLQNALFAIRNDGRKIREAGRAFNIPESTLRKKMAEDEPKPPRLGCKPVFSEQTESELREYVLTLAKLFYGLTPRCLRRLAFRYAEQYNIVHKFDREKGLAGKDWLYGFLRRSPDIKLRQPEGTSLNRIASFNKESTKLFFSNLQTIMDRFKFEPKSVYNMDETGITTVQNKCPKVYGRKGSKKVGAAISGERGRTITAVFSMNAAGNYIPPMMIYPRKRMPKTLEKIGPIGTLYKCSKNGWINSEIFLQWLGHFQRHAKPTVTDPVLLVLDNHSSHISIAAYNFCRENYIHMVSLPPHTSDHLQPLDLTFFSPLKNALFREYELYLSSTGHQKITEYDVAELLNKAFMKVATMEKAVSGFRTSGIIPLDPDKFSDADFEPSHHVGELTLTATHELETSSSQDVAATLLDNQPDLQHQRDPSPQPCTSNDNSFFATAPIPKTKVNRATKRKSRNKQKSEILTSTPLKTQLEEAEEKKRQREEAIKIKEKLKAKNKSKGVIRKCFDSESSIPSSSKKFKSKQKRPPTPESSDSSEGDVSDICDDEEVDDIEDDVGLSFIPPPLNQPATPNEVCGICGEFGKQRELWYRCVLCSMWNHAECTDSGTPKNYKCDLCLN